MTRMPAKAGGKRAGRRAAAVALAGALALVLLGTTVAGAEALERLLLLAGNALRAEPDARTQAIVVLGGRTDRIRTGAVLHGRTGLPLLLTGKGTGDSGYAAESEKMAEILGREFRMEARWIETASIDTTGNARYSWCMLAPHGVRRVAIVTDARHLMRAALEFAAIGFEVKPVVATEVPDARATFRGSDLVPSRQGYHSARIALKEWAALGLAAMRWLAAPSARCERAPARA
jgi:uncharacterized SAM-binding protein YcdF (DUF218 family)